MLATVGVLGLTGAAVSALEGSVTYYKTPTELLQHPDESGVRLGGLVVRGSVQHRGGSITFRVTDGHHAVLVVSDDQPPSSFREGQGVVLEGRLDDAGTFDADQVIVRHSNEYQPPGEPTS